MQVNTKYERADHPCDRALFFSPRVFVHQHRANGNASLSKLRSATSFSNRAFSFPNCFTSCTSLTSIPPYFAFYA